LYGGTKSQDTDQRVMKVFPSVVDHKLGHQVG
jgi:hypothetical protein